jgi:hypothetical protein
VPCSARDLPEFCGEQAPIMTNLGSSDSRLQRIPDLVKTLQDKIEGRDI